MWWTILHDLAEFFRSDETLQGCFVIEGSSTTIEDYPAIEIMRDVEPEVNLHFRLGKVNLHIQPWIRNDDPDPAKGYADIADLEGKVITSINKWSRTPKEDYAVKVELRNSVGDGDAFRPVCGSRIPIHIEWKKVKGVI